MISNEQEGASKTQSQLRVHCLVQDRVTRSGNECSKEMHVADRRRYPIRLSSARLWPQALTALPAIGTSL